MTDAVVQASGLFARDAFGVVMGLDLSLPGGTVGALVGSRADGARALSYVLAGAARPAAGRVLVGGAAPYESAGVRARIGALLDERELPDVGTVRDLLTVHRALRGEAPDRDSWMEVSGLGGLLKTPVCELDRRQTRSVALGLALAVPAPALLLLLEPLANVVHADARGLRQLLRQRAAAGACVLVLSTSCADACALADDIATLQAGRIGRAIGAPDLDELAPGDVLELRVWTDKPRELGAALALDTNIKSVWLRIEKRSSPLVLQTTDLEAAARAVARSVAELGATLIAMQATPPGARQVHAAASRAAARDRGLS